MIAQLLDVLRVLAGRVTLARPYMCEDCPRLRRSLTAAQYRRWAEDYVVLCRCGQPMTVVNHPSYADFRVETSR